MRGFRDRQPHFCQDIEAAARCERVAKGPLDQQTMTLHDAIDDRKGLGEIRPDNRVDREVASHGVGDDGAGGAGDRGVRDERGSIDRGRGHGKILSLFVEGSSHVLFILSLGMTKYG